MRSTVLQNFIIKNEALFWSIKKDELQNISLDLIVEIILNYGNETSVRELFDIIGLKKVSELFYKQTSRTRNNYHPRTKHYFTLYFKKYVQRSFN